MSPANSNVGRIVSLDQFRGYTVAGMFVVNFIGSFALTPVVLRHENTFCSFSDTIMPQFFFAVGFAFRLTFGRRLVSQGLGAAYARTVRRLLGLVLVSLVIYPADRPAASWQQLLNLGFWEALRDPLKGVWFQTLMHIAVTSLWILPVIRAGTLARVTYMLASCALHVLVSHWFYYDWVNSGAIDGGALGFLTWSVPMIVGTLACDVVTSNSVRQRVPVMIAASLILMAIGYLLSCISTLYDAPTAQRAGEHASDPVIPTASRLKGHSLDWVEPPFVPPPDSEHRQRNYWMMSQRSGSVSYQVFAAGFSLAVYCLFYAACDVWRWQLGLFRTLGTNALVAYILHSMVAGAVKPWMPADSPAWYLLLGLLIYFGITYLFVRHLEKNQIYLKL